MIVSLFTRAAKPAPRRASLEALADDTLRAAEARLLAHGDVGGLLVFYRDGAVQAALPLAWSDDGERAGKLARIREIFDALRIDRFGAIVCARATGAAADALHVLAADRGGGIAIRAGVIERDDAGKPVALVPQPGSPAAAPLGDLIGLVRPVDPIAFCFAPH